MRQSPADDSPKLSPAAYLVLALVDDAAEATPYDLKVAIRAGVGQAWPLPHTQVYETCSMLAGTGHLCERREETGRRRRFYSLSASGRAALARWREDPTTDDVTVHDPGLLQLCCGVPLRELAEARIAVHERRLAELRQQRDELSPATGSRLGLMLGAVIARERTWLKLWEEAGLETDGRRKGGASA
jgi:DNA-binding PadR family transcriptional regulator